MTHRYLTLLLTTTVLLLSIGDTNAQHYWVGGSGNWSDANHWATTSGGATFHATAPTMDDDVFFDANSFDNSGQTVTMDAGQGECKSISWSNLMHNPGFESFAPNILNVYGSFTLSPDMTCNLRFVEMESNSAGNTITTGGTSLGANAIFRLQGGGTFDLQDVLTCSDVQIQGGTLNSNGNTINCGFSITTNGNNPKVLNLNNSEINIRQWRTRGSNNTFNMGTANVYTQSFYADEEGTGPYTYGNLVMAEGGLLNGTAAYNNISFLASDYPPEIDVESGVTITCQSLKAAGTKYVPIMINASTAGQQATFSQANGTVSGTYLILRDIHAMGGATFNADLSEDLGNNNGWNITPVTVRDYFWVGNGGGFSDTAHWATTSGGATKYPDWPSRYDNIIFDANSVTEDGVAIVVDTAMSVRDILVTNISHMPAITAAYAHPLTVFGSADFTDSITHSIYNLRCQSLYPGNTVYLSNQGTVQNLSFWGDGDWTLNSEVNCGNFLLNKGSLNTNDQTINCGISFFQNRDISINLTGSEITTLRFTIQDRGIQFDAGTSQIHVTGDFKGKGYAFNEVTFSGSPVVFDQNEFKSMNIEPGASVVFEADSTQTIGQTLTLDGTPSGPINLSSTVNGVQASLSLANGTVDGTYLILKDMNATGGAIFNATQSVDNGNNTGWNITEIIPLDFYWVGDGGDWSDFENHWAKAPGGNDFYGFTPGSQDNVFFDANSFSQNDQIVTIDISNVNFNNMVWTAVTNTPRFAGNNQTMNIYGTITYSENMLVEVENYNFLTEDNVELDFGATSSPGTNAYLNFTGGGSWTLSDSITCREILLEGGTFNTDNHGMHVDFRTAFRGTNSKTLNLGSSNVFTRSLGWDGIGSKLTVNGQGSYIMCTSDFSPTSLFNDTSVVLNFNDLHFLKSDIDQPSIFGDLTLNTLTCDPGTEVRLWAAGTITVNQLEVKGTDQDHIALYSSSEGSQAIISQASGVVDGHYLELKDISATGGAEFNARHSLNSGNVSGWTFFGQAQTIDFAEIDDRLETSGPFDISATASSGLDVDLEIIAGPASLDGATVSLTGAGEVQIKASQAGNINYDPAPAEIRSFCSTPLTPTISADGSDSTLLTSSRADGNQWFRDGVLIEGATNQTYMATVGGLYTVKIIFGSCASESSNSIQITVSATRDLIAERVIRIWPNPVSDYLHIELQKEFTKSLRYSIIDVNGKVIANGKVNSLSGDQIDFDTSQLPQGMYVIVGVSEDGEFRMRFIKA